VVNIEREDAETSFLASSVAISTRFLPYATQSPTFLEGRTDGARPNPWFSHSIFKAILIFMLQRGVIVIGCDCGKSTLESALVH
jgi:hypothetical protein